MKDKNPKERKDQETLEVQKRNALIFPWTPIDGVDMIAGDKFVSSEDVGLPESKKNKKTHG